MKISVSSALERKEKVKKGWKDLGYESGGALVSKWMARHQHWKNGGQNDRQQPKKRLKGKILSYLTKRKGPSWRKDTKTNTVAFSDVMQGPRGGEDRSKQANDNLV